MEGHKSKTEVTSALDRFQKTPALQLNTAPVDASSSPPTPLYGKRSLWAAAWGLVGHGWHVHFLTDPGPVLPSDMPSGVQLHAIRLSRGISPIRDALAVLAWTRQILSVRPRAVIGNSPKGALLGLLAARIAGVKTRIYWIRGAKWDGRDDALGTVLRAMDRGTCRLSTARLAVSQSMVDAYMRQGIASDLTLLGRGGSRAWTLNDFARSRSEKLHDPRDSAYIGRLAHGKGIRYLPFVLDR